MFEFGFLLQTKLKLQHVNVTCPDYAASTKEIECHIGASGNAMELVVDFGDATTRQMQLGGQLIFIVNYY